VRERAEALASEFSARPYTMLSDMLAKEEIDIVSICTAGAEGGSHHFAPLHLCHESGKHVLCETPLSNHLVQAQEMVQQTLERGLYLGVAFCQRFSPLAQKAREWIMEGRLGQLLLVNATVWAEVPQDRTEWHHLRAHHSESCDLLRYFCGEVVKAHSFCNRSLKKGGTEKRSTWSNLQVNLLFNSGVVGHLIASCDGNPRLEESRFEVMGTQGRLVLQNYGESLCFYPREGDEVQILSKALRVEAQEQAIHSRVRRFVTQVYQGVPLSELEANGEDALAAQEILEAICASWEHDSIQEIAL
jgi:predicted dehydrogenase